jgi:hypothetical protein
VSRTEVKGLARHPVDVTAGPHSRCEMCELYFPDDRLVLRFLKMRCPDCAAKTGNPEPSADDLF